MSGQEVVATGANLAEMAQACVADWDALPGPLDSRLIELHKLSHGAGWHYGFDAQTGENFVGFGSIMDKNALRIPVPTFAIAQYIGLACMRMQDKMHYHDDSNNWCDGTPDWCDAEGVPA